MANNGAGARRPGGIAWVPALTLGAMVLSALFLGCPEPLAIELLKDIKERVKEAGEDKTPPPATYAVTYYANGGSGSVPTDASRYRAGDTVTVRAKPGDLAKEGETFIGWNPEAGGGGTTYSAGATFAMGTSDVTLYAMWTTETTYILSYDPNEADGGEVPPSSEHPANSVVTVSANTGGLSKTGHTLSGWNDQANGTGTTYTPGTGTLTMPAGNKTIYAKWTPAVYTVTFNAAGGRTPSPATKQVTYGGTYGVLAATSRSGYTFGGWWTGAGGTGTEITSDTNVTIIGAQTLYAKWTPDVAQLLASDAAGADLFGCSVAIDGDYVVVGAYGDNTAAGNDAGSAWVFHRTGANTWDAGWKLSAGDAATDDRFGTSVAIDGDYVVVGAYRDDTAGGTDAGSAWVFHRTDTNTWDAGVKLSAGDAAAGDEFGTSVAISGDYAVVGAPVDDTAVGSDVGSAWVFHRTGANSWDAGVKLSAGDAAAGDWFGNSVAISGDYAVVGAHGDDTAAGGNAGSAWVFHRTGANSWDAGVKLSAGDAAAGDWFGWSVAISGDYAVVGAPVDDIAGGSDAGSAWVFHRTGANSWDAGVKLSAGDAAAGDWFGRWVAISGDYAVVGAYGDDTAAGGNAGSAYVFHRTGANSWDAGVKLSAGDAAADDSFGYSVAIDGDYAVVGALGDDTAAGSDAGSAHIFGSIQE